MNVKTPQKWWPVYRCPKCGYTSSVTNVCRHCNVWMVFTGWEERGIPSKFRKMTTESELYDNATYASYAYKRSYEIGKEIPDVARDEAKYYTVPPPDWAWYGEGEPKLKKEELYKE